jgi:hypothetical protein
VSNRVQALAGARLSAPAAIAVMALVMLPATAQAATGGATVSGTGTGTGPVAKLPASAAVEQCLTQGPQTERSATFVGEMDAIPGSVHLQMRIDVFERLPQETGFHAVIAPGLGVWRSSAAGVKTYRYLKQVTDLTGPAVYRAAVRFRWVNAKNHTIRALEVLTRRCEQPGPLPSEPAAPAGQAPAQTLSSPPPSTPAVSAGL